MSACEAQHAREVGHHDGDDGFSGRYEIPGHEDAGFASGFEAESDAEEDRPSGGIDGGLGDEGELGAAEATDVEEDCEVFHCETEAGEAQDEG